MAHIFENDLDKIMSSTLKDELLRWPIVFYTDELYKKLKESHKNLSLHDADWVRDDLLQDIILETALTLTKNKKLIFSVLVELSDIIWARGVRDWFFDYIS